MRNLRNIRLSAWDAEGPISAACWDPATDDIICTVGPSAQDPTIKLIRVTERQDANESIHRVVATWSASSPSPQVPLDSVVSLHHLGDARTTCVVLAGGDLVTIVETESEREENLGALVEMVGSADGAIAAAAWSPDGELLIIVTAAGTVILMGRTFDTVAEATMAPEDLSRSRQVSVGWGSRETQFQGRGVRAMRDPTVPDRVDEGILSPRDDGSTAVSWRGDGEYVAVNAVEGRRRVIRVYGRDGSLDGVSEPVDGLEGSLSWRPLGNLIAAIRSRPAGDSSSSAFEVIFFERNGLRHGEFALRTGDLDSAALDRPIGLAWNADSTVLSVMLPGRVQLWTMGNYHWYLKQEVAVATSCLSLAWHPERALRLVVTAGTASLLLAEYVFAMARGSCAPPFDSGAVAVIDGRHLKFTPFRTANVPPPMAMSELEIEGPIVDLAFGPRNEAMAVLHCRGIEVYRLDRGGKGHRSLCPRLVSRIPLGAVCGEGQDRVLAPRQITFSGENRLHVLLGLESGPRLYAVRLGGGGEGAVASVCAAEVCGDVCLSTCEGVAEPGGHMQTLWGRVFRLGDDHHGEPVDTGQQLRTFSPWFDIGRSESGSTLFGLSRNGHLCAGTQLLAKNVTSFLITPSHLVYTTSNHYVKLVHLGDSSGTDLETPPDDPADERCRSIERGARLVTAAPTSMSLVLQMPRGNLETIYPRGMVLAEIRRLIEERDYGRAFGYCRTHRVDMNILCDHRPDQFLSSVGIFLDQVSDVAHLDLFLSSLKDEDITQTMYRDTKHRPETQVPLLARAEASKVNRICSAVLKGLDGRRSTNLQNMITAHVCQAPPGLEDGLRIVADLMQEDESLAEKAVEHICFLVDVDRLYDAALGLYNLDLALLVAQQSQRDPKEYLPFIRRLHELTPDIRRHFAIDDHLGRRERALGHLATLCGSGSGTFEEVRDYVARHALHQPALRLYRHDEPRRRVLTGLLAGHLEAGSRFGEAGLAYESLGDLLRATLCYRAAGPAYWRECIAAAQRKDPPLSAGALVEMASDLADALYEGREYEAAAQLYLDYLRSPEMAMTCLCRGYQFAEAIRLAVGRGRPDLLISSVDPGLGDALASTTEFLADCRAQLRAQVPRVGELRRRAAEDPLAFYEGERPGGGDVSDDVSVASSSRSGSSLFTRYTGSSKSTSSSSSAGASRAASRSRRREEKKRARGRRGTVYEEEYLVASVRRLVERVERSRGEVERLTAALFRRDMAERARAVERLMVEVVEACIEAGKELFADGEGGEDKGGPGRGAGKEGEEREGAQEENGAEHRPVGADAVFLDHVESRGRRQEAPVIRPFKRLSVLG